MARNTFIVQNTQRRLPRNSQFSGERRRAEPADTRTGFREGFCDGTSTSAGADTGAVITNRRQAPLCKALLTPHGAPEGKDRGSQREWGTGKARDLSGPQRVWGGSGCELIHLFSCTPSSLAPLWKYQCFLLEAEILEHFLLCRLSPLLWGLILASVVGSREWSQECLEVTLWENRECLGASSPSCAPISGSLACKKRNRSRSFKISSWWAWFTHSLQAALGLTVEKSGIAEGGQNPDKQLSRALSQGWPGNYGQNPGIRWLQKDRPSLLWARLEGHN